MSKSKGAAAPMLFESNDAPKGAKPKVAEKKQAAKPAVVAQPKQEVATLPPPKNMLAIIATAAANPAVDVAKMKELLAMQREIEERDEVRAFNAAMLAAQEAMPRIVRDKKNDHTKARYPSMENVSKSIDAIARKHGFTMSWGTADSPLKDHYRVVCDLSHDAGHVRRYHLDLPADAAGAKGTSNKTPVQGIMSSISFGRRNLKILMFDLVIVGDDADGNRRHAPTNARAADDAVIDGEAIAVIDQKQVDELRDLLHECGVTAVKFCEVYAIEKLPELPAASYAKACKDLLAHKAKQQGRA